MTHDYKRHGTTTLFAALNAHDGTVIADCKTRHRPFNFDGKALDELLDRCGIVDCKDQWHTVVGAIHYYCDTQLPEDSRGKGLALPFVTAPETFNDENHHSAYTIEQGLMGSCVVCVPIEK